MIDKKAAIEAYKITERNAHDMIGDPAGYLALTGSCPVAVVERQAQRLAELLRQLDEAEMKLAALKATQSPAISVLLKTGRKLATNTQRWADLANLTSTKESIVSSVQLEIISEVLTSLSNELEAECQQSDGNCEQWKTSAIQVTNELAACSNENRNLKQEVSALKGEQVPVALVDERQGGGGFCLTQHGRKLNLQHGTELFTAPQKPVGIRKIGYIDHDGGEFGEYFAELTDSAEIGQAVYVIDAAIEAAGGIVKSDHSGDGTDKVCV